MTDTIRDRIAALSPTKLALLQQSMQPKRAQRESIAVVGMACNFPGAPDIGSFWELIRDGRNETKEVPADRWPVESLFDPDPDLPGKTSSKWACLVDEIDRFDPMFFGVAPREADRMDPQQRLLLTCSYRAMEHAGISPARLSKKPTGVFVGVGQTDYSRVMSQFDNSIYHLDAHCGTGGALSICANRLSYVFNFTGPSQSIDTACSSALVAVHDAVQSLRRGECDAALAGGVNVCLSPDTFISLSKARMLSPSGACRPFDAAADGYVRGEGCGVVLLKRLSDAVRDNDRVLAVIRGSAVNHSGRTSGISAPNGQAQRAVIRAALADGEVEPSEIQYVEAHGTGTPLGDPIEVEALGNVFSRGESLAPVYLTSVKANIGHTEIAAGIAGLIKTVLMMEHGIIPHQPSLSDLNPHLSFDNSRVQIPRDQVTWDPNGPRVAGVSSFGFGGTNSHVVMQSTTEGLANVSQKSPAAGPSHSATNGALSNGAADTGAPDRFPMVLPLSAKTDKALRRVATDMAAHLRNAEAGVLPSIIETAGEGRLHFPCRAAIVANNRDELVERTEKLAAGKRSPLIQQGRVSTPGKPVIAGMFTGQGSQYESMASRLYEHDREFRGYLDRCDQIIKDIRGESLLDVINGTSANGNLNETKWTQPALFALEYSLAKWWMGRGVEFDFLLGHSVGEIAAATVAEVFDLESGLALICRRAELMQSLPAGGSMAVLFVDGSALQPSLEPYRRDVTIASFNGPGNTTISGKASFVKRVIDSAEASGVASQTLQVSHAFHSPLMDPILDEFEEFASSIDHQAPRIPIVSNLTGRVEEDDVFDAQYWRNHIRDSVRFSEGVQCLVDEEANVMIEVGPSATLIGMARRCHTDWSVAAIPSLKKSEQDESYLATSLGKAYVAGIELDWKTRSSQKPPRAALPGYPLHETSFWFKPDHATTEFRDFILGVRHNTPMIGEPKELPGMISFHNRISDFVPAHLGDHKVRADCVVPAAAFIDIALAAARKVFGTDRVAVESLQVQKALFLTERQKNLFTKISGDSSDRKRLEVYSRHSDDESETWELHASASISVDHSSVPTDLVSGDDVIDTHIRVLDKTEFYQLVAERGLNYGPQYQVIDRLYRNEDTSFAVSKLSKETLTDAPNYVLHPAIGDGCLQTMTGVVPLENDGGYCPDLYLPVAVRKVTQFAPVTGDILYRVERTSEVTGPSPDQVEADIYLADTKGNPLALLQGVRIQKIGTSQRAISDQPEDWVYQVAWRPLESNTTADDLGTDEPSNEEAYEGKSEPSVRHWLLVGPESDLTSELEAALVGRGAKSAAENASQAAGPQDIVTKLQLDSLAAVETVSAEKTDPQGLRSRLAGWCSGKSSKDEFNIVVTHPIGDGQPGSVDAVVQSNERLVETFRLLAEWLWVDAPGHAQTWLVSQAGRRVLPDDVVDPMNSGAYGIAQVASQEMRQKNLRSVDLQAGTDAAELAQNLLQCFDSASDEPALAVRNGQILCPRLETSREILNDESFSDSVPTDSPFRLRLGTEDTIDSLRFERLDRQVPGEGEIEIRVHATGLNFSDVLKALGLYPGIVDDIVPMGLECSGVVSAVGPGVSKWSVGDEVMAVVPYGFASHCITGQDAAIRKPESLDHEDAAAIPLAFLTAEYCLRNTANLQPGERVLIHAGAGGVGLAAIQIAKAIGAEIFATAGSDEKREFLREMGVHHVMNSRTLEFAEEISTITDGKGVDVILNSLPGDAIDASLKSLAAYGRFVEIGKIDIYADRPIGLSPFQDNLTYSAVDLDRLFRQRPAVAEKIMGEIAERFESGLYEVPNMTLFPISDVVGAFRFMSQRKNIGKIVVTNDVDDDVDDSGLSGGSSESASTTPAAAIRSDGSYLITGGLGALGMQTARWLAQQGAGGVVLLSRRGGSDADAAVAELSHLSCQVTAVQGDVCDLPSLSSAIDSLPEGFPPIKGIFHAAGVLRDRLMNQMSDEDFAYPLPAKTIGTWNLHTWTEKNPVDFLVLFSSVSAVLGTAGQANYGAANAFMDGFADYRNQMGRYTLSVNWGAFDGSGMAADLGDMMRSQGVFLLPTEKSLALMGDFLEKNVHRITVFRADWERFGGVLAGLMSGDLKFKLVDRLADIRESSTEADDERTVAIKEELANMDAVSMRPKLQEFFAEQLSDIMGIDPEEIDTATSLTTLGMDSLMAMELGNKMQSALGIEMPMSIYLQGPTIDRLADFVVKSLSGESAGADSQSHDDEQQDEEPLAVASAP